MYKKLLGLLFIISKTIYPAIGCDYKLLRAEAETYNDIIWSDEKLPSREEIQESLTFVRDEKQIKFEYGKPENFQSFYHKVSETIANVRFLTFAQSCKYIYDTAADKKLRIASYMLLEQVQEKALKHVKMSERITTLRERRTYEQLSYEDMEKSLNFLLNRSKN